MKNFWESVERLGFLCFIGACFAGFLNLLAIFAASFGFMQPFNYFQILRIPLWSVILPALGIMMFLPLALREAFTYKSAPEEERRTEIMDWRQTVSRWRRRLHLRPV
jgi:hypothetical protein